MRKSITLLLLVLCVGIGSGLKGQLMITEIMYKSPIGGAFDDLEYIELYNSTNTTIDLSGYTFSSGVGFTFPPSSTIDPGEFNVIIRGGNFITTFGIPCQLYNWSSGSLSDVGEAIVLKDGNGNTVDSVFYGTSTPWPSGGNGDGHSITYCNRTRDNQDGDTWIAASEPVSGVFVMGIQMYADPGKCCTYPDVTPPTIVGAGMKNRNRIGIQFSEPISQTSVWPGIVSGNFSVGSVTYGATPDSLVINLSTSLQHGEGQWVHISGVTDTACNMVIDSFRVLNNYITEPVIICEILYDDPSSTDDLEFIEIVNVNNVAIPLGGFNLFGDVIGPLPEVDLLPNGRIVLAKNPSLVASTFGIPDVYGWTAGALDNAHSYLELHNDAGINDSLTYSSTAPWQTGASGTGHSLMLCVESIDNDVPSNWNISNGVGDFTCVYQGDSLFATPWRENCRPVGLLDADLTNFRVYPNPFQGSFEVRMEDLKGFGLTVTDALGRIVKTANIVNGFAMVHLESSPSGIYFVSLVSETGQSILTKKLVRL